MDNLILKQLTRLANTMEEELSFFQRIGNLLANNLVMCLRTRDYSLTPRWDRLGLQLFTRWGDSTGQGSYPCFANKLISRPIGYGASPDVISRLSKMTHGDNEQSYNLSTAHLADTSIVDFRSFTLRYLSLHCQQTQALSGSSVTREPSKGHYS